MTDKPILVIAYDYLGPLHAGPAVRTLALARELSRVSPVKVIYDGEPPEIPNGNISFLPRNSTDLTPGFFQDFQMALAPPLVARTMPELLDTDLPLVIDMFDPVVWENLELYKSASLKEREFQHERHLAALLGGLLRGDYFIVAGERQQDLFVGALMALNRINPSTWQEGQGPGQLVGTVPFGLPDDPPPTPDKLHVPGEYKFDGHLIVWGGGMWDWLNPEYIVEALPNILQVYPGTYLAFPGTKHPNPHVPEQASVGKVKKVAKDLGVLDRLIFGNWLTRKEYLGLLSYADCGVSAHSPGLEARYAVRTRFLDAFWMGLPMVVSGGDEYSGIIAEMGLGVVVDSKDFSEGIIKVLGKGKDAYSPSFIHVRDGLAWSKLVKPLIDWAKSPRLTHGIGTDFFHETIGDPTPRSRPGDLGSLMGRVLKKLKK